MSIGCAGPGVANVGLLRRFKAWWRMRRAQSELMQRRVDPGPHGLSAPLIVSLTSYPKRFSVLHLTLRCLLMQSIRPDGVILWIAHADMEHLPAEVLALREMGLEIRATDDLRSYKKLIPLLSERPDAYIVTADDDHYYPATWLQDLVEATKAHPGQVIGHRCHRVTYTPEGAMQSYEAWPKNIAGAVAGPDVFATGVGGILYPPGSLHPDTLLVDLFQRLCANADDVWFYWMARRQGALIRHVGPKTRVLEWPGSQVENLRSLNRGGAGQAGNDAAIAAMTEYFGRP